MDNIKKYFIRSMVDNADQSKDENDRLNINTNCNETQRCENEITEPRFKSLDAISTEDSNLHFIHKIQSLEEENDRLLSILENKNVISNDSSKASCNYVPDFAVKKISQLTERVQELMSELQTIKSSTSSDYEKNIYSKEIKHLTDKLNLSNKKICNYRNQIMQLKNDLQVTQNALSNEIGDPTLMQAVFCGTGISNFRGRAQQILILQQRVNELQAKQNDSKNNDANSSSVNIRQTEKARTAITEQALKDTRSKVNELTKSLDVWKSRSKALDVEITVLRVQIQKLLSKSELDNQLIDKLKTELSSNNNNQQWKTNDSILKLEESIKLLRSKIEKAEHKIELQETALNDRDMKIAHLQSKIIRQNEIIPNLSMDFSDNKDIFIKKLNRFENQQLVDLLCIAQNQFCEQVKVVVDFKNKFLTEKQKVQKLKSKITLLSSCTSSKQRSNNVLYHLKHELNSDEKLNELQNKLELAEEECAALRGELDTLIVVNKENVHNFTKALKDIKAQFIK